MHQLEVGEEKQHFYLLIETYTILIQSKWTHPRWWFIKLKNFMKSASLPSSAQLENQSRQLVWLVLLLQYPPPSTGRQARKVLFCQDRARQSNTKLYLSMNENQIFKFRIFKLGTSNLRCSNSIFKFPRGLLKSWPWFSFGWYFNNNFLTGKT